MLEHSRSNRNETGRASLVRAGVVAICLLGVVASITVHFQPGVNDHRQLSDAGVVADRQAAQSASGTDAFLRAPAGDPSVPATSRVFTQDTPVSDEIPIAQF